MADKEYELRGLLVGHKKGIRCISIIYTNLFDELKDTNLIFEYIISADCSGTIYVWKKFENIKGIEGVNEILNEEKDECNELLYNDNFKLYKKIEIHEKIVYSLCYSKYIGIKELQKIADRKEEEKYNKIEDHLHIYSGGNDKNIYLSTLNGFIVLVLQGHKNSVCSIVEKSKDILISGDWNGQVFIWKVEMNISNNNCSFHNDENKNDSNKDIDNNNFILNGEHKKDDIIKKKNKTENSLHSNKYTYSILKIIDNHKHAVYINYINDFILTLSQDNILKMWDIKGNKINEIKDIHKDSVRDIILFNNNKNVITFSNDENIHIYDMNFVLLKQYKGHSGFIFYVCVNEYEKIMISCGDDKTIKFWCIQDIYEYMDRSINNNQSLDDTLSLLKNNTNHNYNCIQTIYLTDTLWNVKLLSNLDVVSASNDSYIRIYTNKKNKQLSPNIIQMIENKYAKKEEILNDKNENQYVNDISNIKNVVGKEGDIKIFKNENKYEAYKYENNQWVLIGDVINDVNTNKKFYIGDDLFEQGYYDELFSIDVGFDQIKILPYNKNDNIHLIAEKFCKREHISISHIKSIVDFINQNLNQNNNTSLQNNKNNYDHYDNYDNLIKKKKNFNTILNVITIQQAALDKILDKIKEFNLILSQQNNTYKLNNDEINSISNIIKTYKTNIKTSYLFNTTDINVTTKLFNWSSDYIFPIIDLFRILVLNKNCDFLYNNKYSINAFKLVYDCISYYINNYNNQNNTNKLDSLLLCSLRFYLNMFYLSTPRYFMFKKYNFVLKQISQIQSKNNNIILLLFRIFFNYIITLNEHNDKELRKILFEQIHNFSKIIQDPDTLYTYSLCFHTSSEIYNKQTHEFINKYSVIDFIQNKYDELKKQQNESNEKTFKNISLILEDLKNIL
ncbi:putative polyubiquitin binding protein [Plasmodium gaboni]|uniref:Putative polyubiquitin binding protein n=1 Tax=Plasmodium gaboni TaxID=647221 RepID=A0A151LEK1_9APIC|nr:putative polyubiquitin binding protein [Plasmodium gaboni]KYN97392.1 putative polyubiquitin binding protein [Plasmodium gaboni]